MTRRYEILETAGQGGMGTVYRARLLAEGGFEKIVAVKMLQEQVGDDADLARRLRDEARILGHLQHRAIVRVEGLFRLGGRWTIAMEFIDGIDLQQAMDKRGKAPVATVVDIVKEVASALNHAHAATNAEGKPLSIVHRDLKPANLRITPGGDVKVLDFGVARASFAGREAETRAGGFGSIGYVPPERVDGDELPAGDVYALGVVAWELLSGKRFGPGHLVEKKHAALIAERLEAVASTPEPVRELLRRMMSFDPEKRPSAREVERTASGLATVVADTQHLREWAEENVPPLMKEIKAAMAPDELVGRVFEEESASFGAPAERPVAPPPPPAAGRAEAPPPPAPSRGFGCVRLVIYSLVILVILIVTPFLLVAVLALGVWVGTLTH